MRKLDPVVLALVGAAVVALGTVAYVVGSVLADTRTHPTVPWHADPLRANETRALVERGVRVSPPLPPAHR